ncbi:hypothetical protein [Streptomyces sp. NPDC021356]|uniref:hypothetical protein n=1 Tax=Streptomyces sp. NPDC021356 TaxID=3154900 RepID=UPI0033E89184
MNPDAIDGSVRKLLKRRKLFLKTERTDRTGEIVYVCVDDGHPGGFPVGHVTSVAGGVAWLAFARVRPDSPFGTEQVAAGLPGVEDALRAVLDHAHYGDIMADLEDASGVATTYTATVDRDQAVWLANLDEPGGVTHLGKGRLRLTGAAVAYLRSLPERLDCHVDHKDRLHLADDTYQLVRER